MEKKTGKPVDRRAFLRGGAVAAAGAAATAALGDAAKADGVRPSGKDRAGYVETDHVRRVYELSRF